MPKSRLYDDAMIELLREDPSFTKAYLHQAFLDIDEDGGQEAFLMALRHVVEAQGGMAKVAKSRGISRNALSNIITNRKLNIKNITQCY